MRSMKAVAAFAALILLGMPNVAHADPSDRVARASFLGGQVWMRHGTEQEWMQLMLNYPLTSGDQLWTDAGARSEVRVGATALRLWELTGVNVDAIETGGVRLTLTQGTLALRVHDLGSDDHLSVSTALASVEIMRGGDYRLDTDSLGSELEITVRRGAVVVTDSGGTFEVKAGQAARITAGPNPTQDIHDAPGYDAFDEWAAERDRAEQSSESKRYVSDYMTGYEDLDRYGSWQTTPQYGAVWVPAAVAPGWAPYRFGYWAWVSPWGWTWIDSAPWGFAPYHYGRWAWYGNGWVWVPGVRVVRPVYAPALVAFVGGPGWSVSARFGPSGGVAWFPLAPGEPWVPSYHASRTYIQNVNVTNVNITKVNVTNVNVTNYNYRNRGLDGAITAVSKDDFTAGHSKHGAPYVLHEQDLHGAKVVANAAPVAPRPQNEVMRGATRPATWTPNHVPMEKAHPVTVNPVSRTPVQAAPRQDITPRQQQERELDAKQAREHAQLEEQQQKEQRSAQTAEEQTAMREKHQQQTQEMEARHQQQLQALPPKPATPATAPRHPMTPTVKPNVEKKAPEKSAKEKPDKPARS